MEYNNLDKTIVWLDQNAALLRSMETTPESLSLSLMLSSLYGASNIITALLEAGATLEDFETNAAMIKAFADDLQLVYPRKEN